MGLPLSGFTIVELGHYIAGPLCGQILADFGATVIKVEPPGGEASRTAFPVLNGRSGYFATVNRKKTFVELDLKSNGGREELFALIQNADGLVTNYAAGVPERLGIGAGTLQELNPRLVYTQITGFGAGDDDPRDPAYDGVLQAMSGLAHITGAPDGPPMKAGPFVADNLSAWVAASGTLAALIEAQRTGTGRYIDLSMLDAMFSLLQFNIPLVVDLEKSPSRAGNRSTNVFCTTFPAADGWCYIAPVTPRMWADLCEAAGVPQFAESAHPASTLNGRLENYDLLEEAFEAWTRSLTLAELTDILGARRIAHGPVNSVTDIVQSPLMKRRNMLHSVSVNDQEFTVPNNPIQFTKLSKDVGNNGV